MHGAAYKNLPKVVKLLASKGAKIQVWNREDKYGWTPLAIAVRLPVRQFQAVA
jgi:ankyrin repeat protein